MAGKVVFLTGATSGLGESVALRAVSAGARLRFIARDPGKAEALANRLGASGQSDVRYYIADLSSLAQVSATAESVLDNEPEIHLLINNAALLPSERAVTPEGFELAHAVNLLAPFVLTNALVPRMVESAPARIINVVSGGMYTQGLALDDLNSFQGEYRGSVAYARAKRRLMVLTKMWAAQLAGSRITVNATHPGWVDTPGVRSSLPAFHRIMRPFLRDTEQGTDTVLWLATSATAGHATGKLWHDREARPEYRLKRTIETDAERQGLWQELAKSIAEADAA